MKHFARFILKYSGVVSILGTVLGLIGLYFSIALYKNLRTNIEELLPTTARSVQNLGEVTQRLSSIESLVVLLFSKDTKASRQFVDDLAREMSRAPQNVIAGVEYRIDQELAFFKERQALFIELSDLQRIRDYIRDRIEFEKEIRNPLNIFNNVEIAEPNINMEAILSRYASRASGFDHFPQGYYATADERVRAVIVYMPGKSGDIDGALRLQKVVNETIARLDPKKYAKDLEVRYTGNVQNLIEENAALIADLELSTLVVVVLVALAMLIYYRSLWGTIALNLSLFMGTFWTFGVSYFLVGYLNANSAFMASIVIGNGINFGVIYLARYGEERRKGRDHVRANYIAMIKTAGSTAVAALAAGLSYGSLVLTSFRGFNQFGVIGLVGMVLCWLSAYTLLPAYLTFIHRVMPKALQPQLNQKAYFASFLAWLVDRFPKLIWRVAVLGIILSLATLPKVRNGVLELDLTRLRDKESMEHGSGALFHYIHDIFQRYLSPMVVLPRNRDDSRKIAQALKNHQQKQGKESMIASIQSLDDFTPVQQEEKVKVLKEIKRLLPEKLVRALEPNQQKWVHELLNEKGMKAFTENQLPPMILNKFTEKDGSKGKMVLVDNVPGRGADNADELIRFVQEAREVADSIAPGTPIAGQIPITSDMIAAIMSDGPRATLFAFLAVSVLIIILFHNLRNIFLCLFSLLIGICWLLGIVLHWDLKINFLNFIALPITFGIGVDYGVNVFQRYREEGRGRIYQVIRDTGGAVCLASLTTIIGYGSLLIAGNQAFVSFGKLAVLGEITCVIAAVIALPAYLRVRDEKDLQKNASKS